MSRDSPYHTPCKRLTLPQQQSHNPERKHMGAEGPLESDQGRGGKGGGSGQQWLVGTLPQGQVARREHVRAPPALPLAKGGVPGWVGLP